MDAVYFVASNGDEPEVLYFSEEDAFASGYIYIDGFDEEGIKAISYKLIHDTEDLVHTTCEDDYTTEF